MKLHLPISLLLITMFASNMVNAQTTLAPDQNPNFEVSRARYMRMADSLNEWHSTTFQHTYKAFDWLSDRAEARADRREFRRQLRMERVRWDNSYNNGYYPGNYYFNHFNNGYPRYNSNYYNRFSNRPRRYSVGLNYLWP